MEDDVCANSAYPVKKSLQVCPESQSKLVRRPVCDSVKPQANSNLPRGSTIAILLDLDTDKVLFFERSAGFNSEGT